MRAASVALALAALLAAVPAEAAPRPVVVELFTSQSCSSCPPAEALLGRLADEPGVLPLAFHVTYWDHLSWRDGFSLPAATARQEAYAERLDGGVYTPQAVIDGRTGLVGSDAAAVRAAIARARAEAGDAVPVTVGRADGGVSVRVGPGAGAGTVILIGFDPSRTTRVARGENAGRTIAQANVVRSMAVIGRWSGADAVFVAPHPAGEAAAVLIQDGNGRILGAARL